MKYLSILTLVPLVGALAVAFVPRSRPQLAKQLAMLVSLVVLGVAVATWLAFKTGAGAPRLQLQESYNWIPAWGAKFAFGVDGIALVMIALIALLVPLVILSGWHDAERSQRSVPAYFALLLALEGMMIGNFVATDVLMFYLFFELMLVPMYFLIGSFGSDVQPKQRQYAAVKFFLYSLVGGLFMLAAVIGLWVLGGHTFDWQTLTDAEFATNAQRWLFLGFFLAFAIKAPFFPFHTWLPDAGGAAPAGAAALLVGVMDKVGTFGILRYCLPLFPEASRWFAPWAIALSLVGIIYAALLAVGQNDLKRLVSYTSIAHFGFIGIGIFAFTIQAGSGSVLYMLNHGLATGLLFLVVGMFVARRGSTMIGDFGGAGKLVPVLAGVFFIAGMASLALPGLAPFVSEFLVLIGTFTVNKTVAVIATVGIILAAAYVLWMVQRTTQGTLNDKLRDIEPMKKDLSLREGVVVAPLIALLLVLGFYPKPVLDVINPAVQATLNGVVSPERSDPAPATTVEAGK
ncbi:NADH-quinone oxidoreductase subunit M [Catellatospora sp. KI3]|uniref:NADH-quinone oxidoreductase subunit M n=1 Tax=Catellatospora sp. KI3 TaxID=3041620 RepID=UPI002482CFEA|nr:NADH-quinone oxidoreductase subunit M [Catellatospora sp. KI3]MDI1461904.1 NADH-quinone oxidoreductase subunit M [Catellatospora sp. KI3]